MLHSDVNAGFALHSLCLFLCKLWWWLQERDSSLAEQRELKRETELLKERLDASQAGWAAARSSLEDRERQVAECDASRLQMFQRSLAEMLSDSRVVVATSEDDIMQSIRELLCAVRDKTAVSFIAASSADT